MNNEGIKFTPMNSDHLSLWDKWVEIPHVKEVWFMDGYETTDYTLTLHKFLKFLNNAP